MKYFSYYLFFFFVTFLNFNLYSQEMNLIIWKGNTLKAIAPLGTSDKILGMGYDENFNELNVQVFKGKKSSIATREYSSYYMQIDNTAEINAHAKVFQCVKAGYNKQTNKRYAVLSIYSIDKTVTYEPQGEPQIQCDFYVSKIHYGWSLNYIIEGESTIFNTELSTSLSKWLGVGGDIKNTINNLNLKQEMKLNGLIGIDNGVIIAKNPEETLNKFKRSKESVPIQIEFKAVKDVHTQGIDWNSPTYKEGFYTLNQIHYTVQDKKDNQKNWDAGIGAYVNPDVFVKILVNGVETISGTGKSDSFSGIITIGKKINITKTTDIRIQFWDKDSSEHDFIGEAVFNLDLISKSKLNQPINCDFTGQLKSCIVNLIPQ